MKPENADHAASEPQASQEARLSETVCVQQSTATDAPAPGSLAGGEAWVGRTLGKYHVASVLGHGAMGVVLKACDPLIERDVAIKVLADHLAADATVPKRARIRGRESREGELRVGG